MSARCTWPGRELIAAIVPDAKDKQARHGGSAAAPPNVIVDGPVACAGRLDARRHPCGRPPRCGSGLDIATAVAGASKGVKPAEQELIARLSGLLGLS
jgi:hypothetical protein